MPRPFLSLVFACLLGCSFWVGQELIYEPFVVPILSTSSTVPIGWWLVVLTPEIVVCILVTFTFHRVIDGLLFCALGGLTVTTSQFLAGLFSQPGQYKAIEGGLLHFALQYSIVTLSIAAVVAVVVLVRLGVRRVRAG